MRVLYVDDEPDIREIAEIALGLDPDFDVRTASSAKEAMELLGSWMPHVALLDVMMPEMDGPQLLAAMRERKELANLPVIFVTARAQRSELQSFAQLDSIGVIAKPFNPMTLAQEIRAMIG